MYHLLRGPILRLKVSKDNHSHLIGKKGYFHKRLQAASKTLIHFPEIGSKDLKQPASGKFSCEDAYLDAEDEVLITPSEIELKKEPCSTEVEDHLIQALASSMRNIRSNELLIFRMVFPSLLENFAAIKQELDKIAAIASMESISISVERELPITFLIRGIMEHSPKVAFIVNLIKASIVSRFKVPMSKLYTTDRIASVHWNEVIQVASGSASQNGPVSCPDSAAAAAATPASALNAFLDTCGVTIEFQRDSQVIISGQDPVKILEAKTRLTSALPISLLVASNTVCDNLADQAIVRFLQEFYSVRIGTNHGSFFGSSNVILGDRPTKPFVVGKKVALETHEANFGALFEVKWLLSQSNLPQLLSVWHRVRALWPKGGDGGGVSSELPHYLRSPKLFALINTHQGVPPVPADQQRYRQSRPIKPVLTTSPQRNLLFRAAPDSAPSPPLSSTPAGSPAAAAAATGRYIKRERQWPPSSSLDSSFSVAKPELVWSNTDDDAILLGAAASADAGNAAARSMGLAKLRLPLNRDSVLAPFQQPLF